MANLDYSSPSSIKEVVKILTAAKGKAKVMAGGTDLLVQLRAGRLKASTIVDVKNISELRTIKKEKNGFTIGAAVSGAELGAHKAVNKAWPGVVEGLELIGSTQIQGRASLGGNLCNGSPAADGVPAMIAAGATCLIVGPKGSRTVAVEKIVVGPGKTSLKPGEFVVSFFLPNRGKNSGDAYLRFIPRTEMDIAVVGVGVNIMLDKNGICSDARVSLGAIAPTALLVKDCAKALIGTKIDEAALTVLSEAAKSACNPIDDKRGTIEYRTKVTGVLVKRAAIIALKRARKN